MTILQTNKVKDVWFNEFDHLIQLSPVVEEESNSESNEPDTLGAKQGEFFGAVLRDHEYPWNVRFGGKTVVVEEEGRQWE